MTLRPVRGAVLAVGLVLAGCDGVSPPPDLPRAEIVDARCGDEEPLAGSMIHLARQLDRARMRIVPLRLTGEQARWLLRDGWDPRAADGAVRARAAEATFSIPGMPCASLVERVPPVVMRLAIRPEEGATPPSELHVALLSGGETEDETRLDGSSGTSLVEAYPGAGSAGTPLALRSEPPGALSLDALSVPMAGASIELDKEYRDAIVGSSTREAAFDVAVGPSARLRFAVATAWRPFAGGQPDSPEDAAGAAPAGAWDFRITLSDGDAGPVELFHQTLKDADAGPERWHMQTVDLSAWAGRKVTLTLTADPSGEPPVYAFWGDPVLLSSVPTTDGSQDRPNVLLISLDTLRGDRVGRVDRGVALTPNLDRLAREGVKFTHCRTQAPSTLYGHASMLTGLPPSGHGATTASALSEGVPYLPALLSRAGWATVAITDDGLLDGRFGFARGFDLFRDRFEPVEEKVTAAIAKLKDLPRPWFLFLHTLAVHTPYPVPEGTAARLTDGYAGPLAGLPDGVSSLTLSRVNNGVIPVGPADVRFLEGLYDAQVAGADAALGRLFETLQRDGLWDDTIVAVTADHGEEFDEHGVIAWHSLTCYEEVERVPLIVKPARGRPAGIRSDLVIGADVRSIDITPTILDLAGLDSPDQISGSSLRPMMVSGEGSDRRTMCEIEDGRGAALLLDGWKYHMRTAASVADPRTFRRRLDTRGRYGLEELYDLRKDPGEQNDLAGALPERARAMREALLERLAAVRALQAVFASRAPAPARPREDDEHTRRLKALGYVQ